MCVYVCVRACVWLSGWCFNAQANSCKGERILFNLNLERALKLHSEERQCVCVCVCVCVCLCLCVCVCMCVSYAV